MPKECYGNYAEYPICQGHDTCGEESCYSKTNKDKGVCDCPYKGSCHLMRQSIEMEYRKPGQTNEVCEFYQLLNVIYENKERQGG